MDWKDYFENKILRRGKDYYRDGYIENISRKDNLVFANVAGTRTYHVQIDLDNYTNISCTCPYYEGGDYCKHIAAVLYAIEDDSTEYNEYSEFDEYHAIDIEYDDSIDISVDDIIDNANIDELRTFIKSLVLKQPQIGGQLKTYLSKDISTSDINVLKSQIQNIFDSYLGYDHYIDYSCAPGFYDEVTDFINDNICFLEKNNYIKEAFDLCLFIIHQLTYLDIDDSDGYTSMISESCCEVLEKVLNHDIDLSLQITMLKILLSEINKPFYDISYDIENMVFHYFKDKECLIIKSSFLDKVISDIEKRDTDQMCEYESEKWIPYRIKILMQLDTPHIDIQKYIDKYWYLSSVRQYVIQMNIDNQNYNKAIDYLKESQRMDSEYKKTVIKYSLQLLQIYQKTNNQQSYKDELWKVLTHYKSNQIDHYIDLKKQYTQDEWQEKRHVIINATKQDTSFIKQVYLEEMMLDRLIQLVLDEQGLHSIYQYEDALIPHYEKQLLEKYRQELSLDVSIASTRKK